MKAIRYKHPRSEGTTLAILTAVGLAGLVGAAAVPGVSGREVAVLPARTSPGAERILSRKWRANVRTWAAMIRYLFEPESDRTNGPEPSLEQK